MRRIPHLLLTLCAAALTALPQAPPPPRIAKPPARRPRAASNSTENQLDGNEALFTVLAAINAAGYDDHISRGVEVRPHRQRLIVLCVRMSLGRSRCQQR